MTSRERVQKVLAHEETDRVPVDLQMTAEVYGSLMGYLGITDVEKLFEAFHADIRDFYFPPYCGPELPKFEDGSFINPKGMHVKIAHNEYNSYEDSVSFPLEDAESVEDLEKYPWFSVDDYDFASMAEGLKAAHENYYTRVWTYGPFEWAHALRGFEQFLIDMAAEPEMAHYILEKLTEFDLAYIDRFMETCGDYIDIVFTHDDIGSQNAMMMSTAMWEEFIKPCHVAIDQKIHSYGKKVMYHSCGNIWNKGILDGLLDNGVDILNPLQMCGNMTLEELKKEYGDKFCFHGGFDIQTILPNATEEEVRKETRRILEAMKGNGGFIFAGTHILQNDASPQNIIAMFEEATGEKIK